MLDISHFYFIFTIFILFDHFLNFYHKQKITKLCHLTTLSLVNLEPSTHLHLITQKIKIREKEPKNKEKSQIDFSLLPFLTQHSHHHQNLILPYLKRQFSQVWNPRGGGTNLKHKNSLKNHHFHQKSILTQIKPKSRISFHKLSPYTSSIWNKLPRETLQAERNCG
jgi:hypothetical protein